MKISRAPLRPRVSAGGGGAGVARICNWKREASSGPIKRGRKEGEGEKIRLDRVPGDILSSTFDISRVLNSLGLHAHALVSDRRGRTFPTWRPAGEKEPLRLLSLSRALLHNQTSSPFSPAPSARNELLSYSTVTAFLREWIPPRFFFSLCLSLLSFPPIFFFAPRAVSQLARAHSLPACKTNYASGFSCERRRSQNQKEKKNEPSLFEAIRAIYEVSQPREASSRRGRKQTICKRAQRASIKK